LGHKPAFDVGHGAKKQQALKARLRQGQEAASTGRVRVMALKLAFSYRRPGFGHFWMSPDFTPRFCYFQLRKIRKKKVIKPPQKKRHKHCLLCWPAGAIKKVGVKQGGVAQVIFGSAGFAPPNQPSPDLRPGARPFALNTPHAHAFCWVYF
jgi:hypothetical protein